jgi:hypothetical protein
MDFMDEQICLVCVQSHLCHVKGALIAVEGFFNDFLWVFEGF